MCTLDSSSRIRLAGLPAPTSWEGWATDVPGVVHLRRLATPAPGCLTIDTTGRVRLPTRLREWLTLRVHLDDDPTAVVSGSATNAAPVRQVVVVSAPPYQSIALGASWILSPLLGLSPQGRDELALAT